MKTNFSAEQIADLLPSKSSVLTKVPPETRLLLNQAIIERNPMTYEGVYGKFALDTLGVSYTAFYYYARRIRMAAAVSELSKLDGDPHEIIPSAVAQSVLEISLDPALASKYLLRAAQAYKAVEQAHAARKRIELAEKSQEDWLAREALRQKNRLELEAIRHANRMALEDRRAENKRQLAREKIQAAKEAAQASGAGVPARQSTGSSSRDPYPPGALYGHDPNTNRPHTRAEFMNHLRRAASDIYGLNLPEDYGNESEEKRAAFLRADNIRNGLIPPDAPTPSHSPDAAPSRHPTAPPRNRSVYVPRDHNPDASTDTTSPECRPSPPPQDDRPEAAGSPFSD